MNSFQVWVVLLPELSMIIFWAKNASTTTTMMGNAALLKNLLTGWFAYLPAGVAERYHGGFPLHWRPRALRYTGYAARPAAVHLLRRSIGSRPWRLDESEQDVGNSSLVEGGDVGQAAVALAEVEAV